ncbi:PH domain-containing protein [Paenibacillus sp. B2(2019)]|uniref:PH domain-containing protein n=1 Tax=Paenibacillus sp. B2(2019) TaxID=2607754 RepID=UPI0021D2174F|nr:PH domain-containing protein [Paenibacillus sp. B2(2019)]
MGNVLGGLLGNYSEVTIPELKSQYGAYLMPQEEIQMGFKLIRDAFIITDDRLILIDHHKSNNLQIAFYIQNQDLSGSILILPYGFHLH